MSEKFKKLTESQILSLTPNQYDAYLKKINTHLKKHKKSADKETEADLKKMAILEKQVRELNRQIDKLEYRENRHDILVKKYEDLLENLPTKSEIANHNKKALPKSGAFTAYKKVNKSPNGFGYAIVTLEVPAHAKRVTPLSGNGKSRVSEAIVKEIKCHKTGKPLKVAYSRHDASFVYRVGKTVVPDKYNGKIGDFYCTHGIHCFLKESDARSY